MIWCVHPDHSIIAECCKEKQTYSETNIFTLPLTKKSNPKICTFHSLQQYLLFNTYGKGIAIILEMDFNPKTLLKFTRK